MERTDRRARSFCLHSKEAGCVHPEVGRGRWRGFSKSSLPIEVAILFAIVPRSASNLAMAIVIVGQTRKFCVPSLGTVSKIIIQPDPVPVNDH